MTQYSQKNPKGPFTSSQLAQRVHSQKSKIRVSQCKIHLLHKGQNWNFCKYQVSWPINQENMVHCHIWTRINQEIMQSCKVDQIEENLEIFSKLKSCSSALLLKVVIFYPSVHWFYSRHVLKDGIIYFNIEEGINLKWHKDWKT